jgi:hypothetical protein
MSKDFADDAGAYLDFPETNRYALIANRYALIANRYALIGH